MAEHCWKEGTTWLAIDDYPQGRQAGRCHGAIHTEWLGRKPGQGWLL
jgi:hypothetical protein